MTTKRAQGFLVQGGPDQPYTKLLEQAVRQIVEAAPDSARNHTIVVEHVTAAGVKLSNTWAPKLADFLRGGEAPSPIRVIVRHDAGCRVHEHPQPPRICTCTAPAVEIVRPAERG